MYWLKLNFQWRSYFFGLHLISALLDSWGFEERRQICWSGHANICMYSLKIKHSLTHSHTPRSSSVAQHKPEWEERCCRPTLGSTGLRSSIELLSQTPQGPERKMHYQQHPNWDGSLLWAFPKGRRCQIAPLWGIIMAHHNSRWRPLRSGQELSALNSKHTRAHAQQPQIMTHCAVWCFCSYMCAFLQWGISLGSLGHCLSLQCKNILLVLMCKLKAGQCICMSTEILGQPTHQIDIIVRPGCRLLR